jgi:hypothetical protein
LALRTDRTPHGDVHPKQKLGFSNQSGFNSRCSMRVLLFIVSVAVAGSLTTSVLYAQSDPVTAQNLAEARRHFERGIHLFDQQDYHGALAEFLRSFELSGRPSVLFNISATYEALHQYPEAVESLERVLAMQGLAARQRSEGERALSRLRDLLGHVRLSVQPDGARISLDGRTIPSGTTVVPVGPGRHIVEATLEGYQSGRTEFMIASGETFEATLSLVEVPPATNESVTSPLGPSVAPSNSSSAQIQVLGVPPEGTIRIAGREVSGLEPIELRPGTHHALITAPGMRPWQGTIELQPADRHMLQVQLAPERRGPTPTAFWTTFAITGVLATASATLGGLALQNHQDFTSRYRDDPELDQLEQRGQALNLATDITLLATVACATTALVLFIRTEFKVGTSTAQITMNPTSQGAFFSSGFSF